jgi:hypothetical protein
VPLAYERRFQAPSEVLRFATRPASPVSACDEGHYTAVEQSVWESMKKAEAQALKTVTVQSDRAPGSSRNCKQAAEKEFCQIIRKVLGT